MSRYLLQNKCVSPISFGNSFEKFLKGKIFDILSLVYFCLKTLLKWIIVLTSKVYPSGHYNFGEILSFIKIVDQRQEDVSYKDASVTRPLGPVDP